MVDASSDQARNQLGTLGGAKSFLKSTQIFSLRKIVLKYVVQHTFPGEAKTPLRPPTYGRGSDAANLLSPPLLLLLSLVIFWPIPTVVPGKWDMFVNRLSCSLRKTFQSCVLYFVIFSVILRCIASFNCCTVIVRGIFTALY